MSDEHIKVLQRIRDTMWSDENIAALDAAIAALGGGWLPIESAPTDGSRVLISDNGGVFIARYWMEHWRVGDLPGLHAFPSVWMPLPAPPSKEG